MDGLTACSGSPSDLAREQLPSRRPRAMAMNRRRLKAGSSATEDTPLLHQLTRDRDRVRRDRASRRTSVILLRQADAAMFLRAYSGGGR
jgi:hypothetical protein